MQPPTLCGRIHLQQYEEENKMREYALAIRGRKISSWWAWLFTGTASWTTEQARRRTIKKIIKPSRYRLRGIVVKNDALLGVG